MVIERRHVQLAIAASSSTQNPFRVLCRPSSHRQLYTFRSRASLRGGGRVYIGVPNV